MSTAFLYARTELRSPFSIYASKKLFVTLVGLRLSTFTLYAVLKGNKPDFHQAMSPEHAPDFYNKFLEKLKSNYQADLVQELQCLKSNHVLVIGATCRPDTLDPSLRRAGRFDKEIGLGIPNEAARFRILTVVTRNLKLDKSLDLKWLAKMTPGFVGADLSALIREASWAAVQRILKSCQNAETNISELEHILHCLKSDSLLNESSMEQMFINVVDFEMALKNMHPSAKREGFTTVPDVSWGDIGALHAVRNSLKWSILYPIKCSEEFESMGLGNKAQGVLLCGPPGCGKTLLAKAVANETGMNFLSVKGPELLSMYVGESERAVRQVFQRATNSAPCVIFFDELDALCPRRSDHDSGGAARVVNQLLTEMDGIEARKHVFIMAASNRPDMVDPAVLRPGRLDKVLYVGFPSTSDKVEIFRAITKNKLKPLVADDVDFESLSSDPRLQFFSGADMAALVREAATASLREHFDNKECGSVVKSTCVVNMKHFEAALTSVKPSVAENERKRYDILRLKYSC